MGINYSELGETPFRIKVARKDSLKHRKHAASVVGSLFIIALISFLVLVVSLDSSYLVNLLIGCRGKGYVRSDLEDVDGAFIRRAGNIVGNCVY